MAESKNDVAWNRLFTEYNILDQIKNEGKYVISSEKINKFREARLMTKFDHSFQLPKLFRDEKLSVLPISRGEYVIAPINTFCEFHDNGNLEITDLHLPSYLESLDFNNITSEAMAINCAYVSGIISDFTNDSELLPTVSGRMSSQSFDFTISLTDGIGGEQMNINVNNSQIEIDGGYEGINSLNLIEAKNSFSSDFLVRQLYYPYRLWSNRIGKKVRPLFLVYSNGIFYLREYTFEDIGFYNSIKLINEKKYRIKDSSLLAINIQTIEEILEQVGVVVEPTDVAFPQADSFERVINLCEVINKEGELSKESLSSNYEFTVRDSFASRQVNYYTDAAIYLGFVSKHKAKDGVVFQLTEKGKRLFSMDILNRQLCFARAILSHSVFKRTLELYFRKANVPTTREIVSIMKTSDLHNVKSDSTFERRSSTIIAWINWIVDLIEE